MSNYKDWDLMMDPEHEAENAPHWYGEDFIDSRIFCEEFLAENPMLCINDQFFTVDGRVNDEGIIKKKIYDKIRPWFASGLPKKVAGLMDCLRIECYSPPLPTQPDRIHVANGTYFLDGHFTPHKEFCLNRLPVAYRPDAPKPEKWLEFLDGLLIPEDVRTLQEYLGYCLIPSTKAQKMLFLIGKGGEGKSRIGVVMRSIFGGNMNTGNLFKVEENCFARADLEYALLMIDDDLKLEALPQTNVIKSIVTAELPMDLEKKCKQSYQGRLYVRFLGFGNGTLQALYDRSVGFFRRQLILTVKDRPENRVDDPFIADKMCAEAEGIFLWALEGLHRLQEHNFVFTMSDRAKENMTETVKDANNIIDFLASEGYIRFKMDYEAATKDLYDVYKLWCDDNAYTALSNRSFSNYLGQHADDYNLEATNNVHIGGGKRCRGYWGIELLIRPEK